MIILISFLGLIRNFKKTSHLFLNTIFNNNPDITFHILFHTSTFSSQISKKKNSIFLILIIMKSKIFF